MTKKEGLQKFFKTNRKYFSRNMFEKNLRASKNFVGPGHPTASARHCSPP